jgi:glycine/sarcosine N-methyltransferase
MEKNILSQLDFFERLSDSFDQLISWPTRIGTEGMFFKKLVTDNKLKSSLDVACSTGFHVIMLRRLGLDASGIDASPKMIQKARTNSVTCGVTVEYILGDFMNMSKRFSEGFDLITCLGDTIAHLRSTQDLKRLFQEVYKSLNPGGLFVIQARNYDFIMKHEARFTPPTGSRNGTEETLFFRLLDFNPKTLNLSIAKFRWHENRWESSVYTTEIHPYLKKELESALKSVGFAKLDSYRNYNFEDYDPNGSDIILIAQKKGVLKSKNASRRDKLTARPEPTPKPASRKELPSKAPMAQPSKAKLLKPIGKQLTKRKKINS